MGSPEDHIAAREERVKGLGAQLSGHGFEGLDGHQRDCGIHMRGLAEEPVTDDALAVDDVDLIGIRGAHLGGTITGTAEIGVAG
ncbi:hypothetical protein GCM10023063_35510 [Arthrobacter methylotrophus]